MNESPKWVPSCSDIILIDCAAFFDKHNANLKLSLFFRNKILIVVHRWW
jgi:uncharacterized protein YejL (UPF0352 family)